MIDLREVKKNHPKSFEELKKFVKKYLGSFWDIAKLQKKEEVVIPEATDEMAEKYAISVLSYNYRMLYDFFDKQEIDVFVTKDASGWNYYAGKEVFGMMMKNRISCEIKVFEEAFKELEKQL